MYKILAHPSIYQKIDLYGDMFFDVFLSRFTDTGMGETSFRMGNRRIFLTYEEDEKNLTRYITDIEILRK